MLFIVILTKDLRRVLQQLQGEHLQHLGAAEMQPAVRGTQCFYRQGNEKVRPGILRHKRLFE